MAAAPSPTQQPPKVPKMCREGQASGESAPDVVIARLVSRVADLEEQLYSRELDDNARTSAGSETLISRIAEFIGQHLTLVGTSYEEVPTSPNASARIAAQSIIDATERMHAAEQEAMRLSGLLATTAEENDRLQAAVAEGRAASDAQLREMTQVQAALQGEQAARAQLQSDLEAATAACQELQADGDAMQQETMLLQGRLPQLKAAAAAAEQAASVSAAELAAAAHQHMTELRAAQAEAAEMEAELKGQLGALQKEAGQSAATAAALRNQLVGLLSQREDAALERGALQAEIHGNHRMMESLRESSAALRQQLTSADDALAAARVENTDLQRKFLAEQRKRRQAHEQLQTLRGNIRVLCRVRPVAADAATAVDCSVPGQVTLVQPDKRPQSFEEFNAVFGPASSQEEVYDEVQPLVRSVLDGYSACIFAYGQTGSGKTHTMSGPESDPGINRRALQTLFDVREEEWIEDESNLSVAYYEIYNETIRDLLSAATDWQLEVSGLGPSADVDRVPGLTWREVETMQDVSAALKEGQRNRSKCSTAMNASSSRSHALLSVRLQPVAGGPPAVLHLIDLAGSERVAKSEAAGQQLKEAQNINRSLSALGDVISALQQKAGHIPFRNSKLTSVLQDALWGSSKAMLVCNLSPEATSVSETLSSLKFAARAAQVELGPIRKNAAGEEHPGDAASDTPLSASRRTPLGMRSDNAVTPPTAQHGGNKKAKGKPPVQGRRQSIA